MYTARWKAMNVCSPTFPSSTCLVHLSPGQGCREARGLAVFDFLLPAPEGRAKGSGEPHKEP